MVQPPLAVEVEDQEGGKKRKISIRPRDIVALGVVILAMGAVLVAIIVAIGLVLGRLSGKEAGAIIVACVGGSAIAAVVAALVGRRGTHGKAAEP